MAVKGLLFQTQTPGLIVINVFNCRGLPSQAFEYIRYSGGLEAERDYPYLAHNQKCHFNGSLIAATVSNVFNFTQVPHNNV